MIDQAKRLRELAEEIKADKASTTKKKRRPGSTYQKPHFKQTRVIAVTSGKGGVGKTNLTANLALALSRLENRVLIFDADLGLANVDVMMGISPKYNLQHVLHGEKEIMNIICEGPENVKLIANGSGVAELANLNNAQRNHFINQMIKIEGLADIMIIDTGAGISRNVLGFILAAGEIIVITTPEPTAIMDAYGIIKIIARENRRAHIKLIVNMVQDAEEAAKVQKKIFDVSQHFLNIKISDYGYILHDKNINLSIRKQTPILIFNPDSAAALCIKNIAARLTNQESIDPLPEPDRGISGFFKRFLGKFD